MCLYYAACMAHPRNPKNWCKCGKFARNSRSGLCRSCWCEDRVVNGEMATKTLATLVSTYARHRYQLVRAHAHKVMKLSGVAKECKFCGYDTHVELCHIKSISSFGLDSLVRDVNAVDNLCWLCRNHHWELENGVLGLDRNA